MSEFQDFTLVSSWETVTDHFAHAAAIGDAFLFKEHRFRLVHVQQPPSGPLAMFDSLGHRSVISRVFNLDEFYLLETECALSESSARLILSSVLMGSRLEGRVFALLADGGIIGFGLGGGAVQRLYEHRTSLKHDIDLDAMQCVSLQLEPTQVAGHLAKNIREKNVAVNWFPWIALASPVGRYVLQFVWPSIKGSLDGPVTMALLETAPIWVIRAEFTETAGPTDVALFLEALDDLNAALAADAPVKLRTFAHRAASRDRVLKLLSLVFESPDNSVGAFKERLGRAVGLALAYSMASEGFDFSLLAQFWADFVQVLRSHFTGLDCFLAIASPVVDLSAPVLVQKLALINYCTQKEQHYQLAHGRPSDSRLRSQSNRSALDSKFGAIQGDSAADVSADAFYDAPEIGETAGRLERLGDARLGQHPEEPLWVPVTQESGVATSDVLAIYEAVLAEEGASKEARLKVQTRHLVSDMEAFKAANPLACFDDFVRWHSPKDWDGQLSARMAAPGNLWLLLWEAAEAVPAARQKPIFDPHLEAEKCLFHLEDISVSELIASCTDDIKLAIELQLQDIALHFGQGLEPSAPELSVPYYVSLDVRPPSRVL